MDAIRVGKTEESGQPLIVVELFGVPLASSTHKVAEYDADPEGFTKWWREYFARQIVSMLAEGPHHERRGRGQGKRETLLPPSRRHSFPGDGEPGFRPVRAQGVDVLAPDGPAPGEASEGGRGMKGMEGLIVTAVNAA